MIHEVKIKEKYADEVLRLVKAFEVRKHDRDFQVGDWLGMNIVDESGEYTGNAIFCRIRYMLDDPEYCKEGYCVLGIENVQFMERECKT